MPLLIAFSSYRARDYLADVIFYRHDGVSQGEIIGSIPIETPRLRSDYRPRLSSDGRYCAFSIQYREVLPGEIGIWDRQEKKLMPLPIHTTAAAETMASLSGDGRWLAFAGWKRAQGSGGWDVFRYDLRENTFTSHPGLNTAFDEDQPALSGDGRWLAYAANDPPSPDAAIALSGIRLYDCQSQRRVELPGITPGGCRDTQPSLSADGRYLAFVSDRPVPGQDGRTLNIHLYDREAGKLLPLHGLNSPGQDSQPSLSAGGRYLVFVSDRLGGAGQQDVYLYDRRESKLLPTPGLNHATEDFEPSIAVLDENLDRI